jgi:hypothetical protein
MNQKRTSNKSRRLGIYALAIVIIAVLIFASVYFVFIRPGSSSKPSTSSTRSIRLTLYEGEINATAYGFGTSPSDLSSPGPMLNLTQDITYTVTVYNIGAKPHNWAIIGAQWAPIVTNGALTPLKPISTTFVQFSAQIGSDADPIQPGSSGTVTFTITPDDVNQYPSLTYAYCSQCSQDANSFSMWGPMTVYSA